MMFYRRFGLHFYFAFSALMLLPVGWASGRATGLLKN